MKTLRLLLLLLLLPLAARAQEAEAPEGTTIGSVHVVGLDRDRLSPGLRRDLDAMVGQRVDRGLLTELADRIEMERPEVVAAVRSVLEPKGDARVMFLVARVHHDDEEDFEHNINARYTIERVDIDGIPEADISQALRDELHALVGTRLDHHDARNLTRKIRRELSDYDVDRRVSRGSEKGQVILTFEIRKGEGLRWLHYTPTRSKFLFHQDQGWSGLLDIPIGGRDVRVTPRFALDNRDDLVEEYSGAALRFEARTIGGERFGLGFELAWYEPTWQTVTLAYLSASPGIPAAYDTRTTAAPWVMFAVTPHLRANAGVSITGLEPLSGIGPDVMASAFTASAAFDQRWDAGDDGSHTLDAAFDFRSATDGLGSDLFYKRYLGTGSYRFRWNNEHQTVIASAMAGRITGQAPLFERFTLGDSSTLRGWDKYDIAPAGADAMYHASVEYRYWGLAFFADTGSVWNQGADPQVRVSTGIGFHLDNFFATLGIPLNADNVRAAFMIGVRF